jgi:hypothetical protein
MTPKEREREIETEREREREREREGDSVLNHVGFSMQKHNRTGVVRKMTAKYDKYSEKRWTDG